VKWYQLHLSTLLAVTLLAGVLVWLNVTANLVSSNGVVPVTTAPSHFEMTHILTTYDRGWPARFQVYHEWPASTPDRFRSGDEVDPRCVAFDTTIGLGLLAIATVALEWLTRRVKRGAP
jgi:hypothetical protein